MSDARRPHNPRCLHLEYGFVKMASWKTFATALYFWNEGLMETDVDESLLLLLDWITVTSVPKRYVSNGIYRKLGLSSDYIKLHRWRVGETPREHSVSIKNEAFIWWQPACTHTYRSFSFCQPFHSIRSRMHLFHHHSVQLLTYKMAPNVPTWGTPLLLLLTLDGSVMIPPYKRYVSIGICRSVGKLGLSKWLY